jgi:hypothetical protein
VEIEQIMIQGQPHQKSSLYLISTNKPGMVVCTFHARSAGNITRRIIKQDPIPKITKAKNAGCMAQVVKYLTSKCKFLNSTSNTTKKIFFKD